VVTATRKLRREDVEGGVLGSVKVRRDVKGAYSYRKTA